MTAAMPATSTTADEITVRLKPCGCGVLVGEVCDCAELAAQLAAAPDVTIRTGGES